MHSCVTQIEDTCVYVMHTHIHAHNAYIKYKEDTRVYGVYTHKHAYGIYTHTHSISLGISCIEDT